MKRLVIKIRNLKRPVQFARRYARHDSGCVSEQPRPSFTITRTNYARREKKKLSSEEILFAKSYVRIPRATFVTITISFIADIS